MKIYLLNRTDKWYYDDFDSMVYVASTKYDAVSMSISDNSYGWPTDKSLIHCEEIGIAHPDMKAGLIISSFNAG